MVVEATSLLQHQLTGTGDAEWGLSPASLLLASLTVEPDNVQNGAITLALDVQTCVPLCPAHRTKHVTQ